MSIRKLESLLHRLEHKEKRYKKRKGKGYLGVGHPVKFGIHRDDGYKNNITGSGRSDWLNQAGTVGGALMGGWDNMAGEGGALMGGDWNNIAGTVGGRRHHNRRHKRRGSALMGGWDNMAGEGGALMGGDWLSQAGTVGGLRHRRHKRRGSALMGGNMDDYQHVGSDWQNMPGYHQGGAYYMAHPIRGVVNFSNNRGFYPPPNYDLNKYKAPAPMVLAARRDMMRRNRNSSHFTTSNPTGLGSGRKGNRNMPKQLSAWNHLVDEVQRSYRCDRKEAMKIASVMYRKKR